MRLDSLKVGITGGIGSGKTTVSKVFRALGIPVYYADDRAKVLMVENPEIVLAVKELFGDEAYDGKQIQRSYIAKKAFQDASLLKQLNQVVHPAVARDYETWFRKQAEVPYALNEAALHFETGGFKRFDKMILVSAPEEVRITRVLKRDQHRSENDVRAIIKNQMSEEEKLAQAGYIIVNDGSSSVIKQVLAIHADLMS